MHHNAICISIAFAIKCFAFVFKTKFFVKKKSDIDIIKCYSIHTTNSVQFVCLLWFGCISKKKKAKQRRCAKPLLRKRSEVSNWVFCKEEKKSSLYESFERLARWLQMTLWSEDFKHSLSLERLSCPAGLRLPSGAAQWHHHLRIAALRI